MTCIPEINEAKPVLAYSQAWVHDVLEPDQLANAKHPFRRKALSGWTLVLLWGLRVYIVLMVLLIGLQIWNVVHNPSPG